MSDPQQNGLVYPTVDQAISAVRILIVDQLSRGLACG